MTVAVCNAREGKGGWTDGGRRKSCEKIKGQGMPGGGYCKIEKWGGKARTAKMYNTEISEREEGLMVAR